MVVFLLCILWSFASDKSVHLTAEIQKERFNLVIFAKTKLSAVFELVPCNSFVIISTQTTNLSRTNIVYGRHNEDKA